jgi:branched-subunit amino acid transport protein
VSIALILVVGALTYGSRALSLALLPEPPERLRAILDRVPAPLFAGLASASLFQDGEPLDVEAWGAAFGAVAAAPKRSLLWALMGGAVGYALFSLF